VWSNEVRYFFIYHLFGALWINAFIIGCAQFIVSAACCIWYFSFTSDTHGRGSLCMGFKWILRYHIGSIAFGSCIIAIVQLIRIIFEYYRSKIQAANKENPVIKCLLCCTSYLLMCLERCIKFITKNAYIQVALASKNFCRSAWNAFLLVVKNCIRFGVTHSIGCIFMFLGRLFIICATVAICYV
jgi:choline transporter-like protein 2/4/5